MPNATDTDPASQAAATTYRPVRGGREPNEWVVIAGPLGTTGPAVLAGFKTEKHAQEAADTLNSLELDERRTDEVLGQMLGTPRKR